MILGAGFSPFFMTSLLMIPYTVPSKIYQVIPELDAIVQHDRGGALILDRFFPVG